MREITSEELSIHEAKVTTNNGAESYHAKLKSIIKISHPRIWNFMTVLNDIVADTDNEVGRLRLGKDISRPRKKKNVLIEERWETCKEKLRNGTYTPWQYLQTISHTVGSVVTVETEFSDVESESESENDLNEISDNMCVVCLAVRTTTWLFLPCRHANCCSACSERIEELELRCPVCRAQSKADFRNLLNYTNNQLFIIH